MIWISEVALFGIGIGALLGTMSGWVVMKLHNQQVDTQIPFAKTIRQAIIKNKGRKPGTILVMMQPGTYTGEVLIGEIDRENKSVFDLTKYGIGEHLVPESYVKPVIIDGIRIYFASYVDAECMGIDEIRANNRLNEIQQAIPELRGIPISTLNTLLQQSPADWEINCANMLYRIRIREQKISDMQDEDLEYCGIPENTASFVDALMRAKQMMERPTSNTSDYIITTYESVIKRKKDEEPIREPADPPGYKFECLKAKLLHRPKPVKPYSKIPQIKTISDNYEYKQMLKKYRGIKFLAPSEALHVRDSSVTVSAIQRYGMEMETRGKLGRNDPTGFMDKYGKYLFPFGVFFIICCVGLGVLFIILNKG